MIQRIPGVSRTLIDVTDRLTELGAFIESARAELRISAREAARRAGISPTRWRQVVTGSQVKRGRAVPVNPTARTVVAMALAVLADPAAALTAAGLVVPANLDLLVEDVRGELRGRETAAPGPVIDLSAADHERLNTEIARIERMRLPESAKLTMLEALIRAWERYAVERDSGSATG
ncbi:MAG TPA: hypothetical protein VJ247_01770 [Gaiella sp.]|nr:hypothetical protein [Gaiella sp.]